MQLQRGLRPCLGHGVEDPGQEVCHVWRQVLAIGHSPVAFDDGLCHDPSQSPWLLGILHRTGLETTISAAVTQQLTLQGRLACCCATQALLCLHGAGSADWPKLARKAC